MPRARKKTSSQSKRRTQRTAEVPQVPVVVPDGNSLGSVEPSSKQAHAAAQPDPVDERVRRMVEAAYT